MDLKILSSNSHNLRHREDAAVMRKSVKRVQKTQKRTLLDSKFVRWKSSKNEVIDLTEDASTVSINEKIAAQATRDTHVTSNVTESKQEAVPSVGPKTSSKKAIPWYKKLQFSDVTITMDCFNCNKEEGIDLYFLSHFHADHYMGLKKSWSQGTTIYTSSITARLVKWKFKVNQCKVIELPLNQWLPITEDLQVFLIDANHCPGSVIFLFRSLSKDEFVLHTGDFRANEVMVRKIHTLMKEKPLSVIYLDTTYLNPYFKFPPLKTVCEVTANFASILSETGVNNFLNDSRNQRTISHYLDLSQKKPILFIVLSYSIGKEHLAIGIASKLNSKIHVPHTKYQLVKQYLDWFPDGLITTDHTMSNVHLVSMHTNLDAYLSQLENLYDSIIVFKPTGWTFTNQYDKSYTKWDNSKRADWVKQTLSTDTPFNIEHFKSQRRSQGKIHYFNVPYSEHSSFKDLSTFATDLRWKRIIPTVNLSQYKDMEQWFDIWRNLKDDDINNCQH